MERLGEGEVQGNIKQKQTVDAELDYLEMCASCLLQAALCSGHFSDDVFQLCSAPKEPK